MNKLMLISNIGFKVSWKLIYVGLYGYEEIPTVITRNDVIEYLDSLLISENDQTDDIITLIYEEDLERFDKLLKKFALNDFSNIVLQKCKWRAFLLKELLNSISHDCLQGLLELMEFWISMGYSDSCPQYIPNNASETKNYFTQEVYESMLNKNHAWLDKEILDIINLEN